MTLELVALGMAALAVTRANRRARSLGLLGALATAVGAASLRVVAGNTADLGGTWAVDGSGPLFLQTAVGLLLLGAILAVVAGPRLPATALAALAAWGAWPLPRMPGMIRAAGIAAGVVAVAVGAWLALTWLRPGRILAGLDRLLDPAGRQTSEVERSGPLAGAALAAALATTFAVAIPHLYTTLGGTVIAASALGLAEWRDGRRPWLFLPATLLIFLVLLWSVRLAGPLGGWLPTLVEGPFSPRAAMLLGAMCTGAAWMVAGAWPLHGIRGPRAAALLVIPLVAIYATLLVPDGLRHWQPLLAPLTLLGMMHAVAVRRADRLLLQGGLLGLWTGTWSGALGGSVLVVAAVVLARRSVPLPEAIRLAELVPAGAALLVLLGHLQTEVTYALAGVAILAVALGVAARNAAPAAATPVAPPR